VIVKESLTGLSAGAAVYHRVNANIDDSDNLTLAIRKEDRTLAAVETALNRFVYDESVHFQKLRVICAADTNYIKSGSYMYQGPQTNPTWMAYVLHGTKTVLEMIESSNQDMPGGHASFNEATVIWNVGVTYSLGNTVLRGTVEYQSLQSGNIGHVPESSSTYWARVGYVIYMNVANSFTTGLVYQSGTSTACSIESGYVATSPAIAGDLVGTGVILVLPPNRRTQILANSTYLKFASPCTYHASTDQSLAGEELMVIANDTIREAGVDYEESFGGPKGMIKMRRTMPPNTRMRFRLLGNYGSAINAKASGISLQQAYNGGNTVSVSSSAPIAISCAGDLTTAMSIQAGLLLLSPGIEGVADKSFHIGTETSRANDIWSQYQYIKTHDNYAGSYVKTFTATHSLAGTDCATTTTAVATTDGFAYRIKISAVARLVPIPLPPPAKYGEASFKVEGTFFNRAGVVTMAGSPSSDIFGFNADGINYALEFAISGTDIVAYLYGSTLGTTLWAFTVEVQAIGGTAG
jgi:hypothetical protein